MYVPPGPVNLQMWLCKLGIDQIESSRAAAKLVPRTEMSAEVLAVSSRLVAHIYPLLPDDILVDEERRQRIESHLVETVRRLPPSPMLSNDFVMDLAVQIEHYATQ